MAAVADPGGGQDIGSCSQSRLWQMRWGVAYGTHPSRIPPFCREQSGGRVGEGD